MDAEWDHQWESDPEYLNWLEIRIKEFSRLLNFTGNLILYSKRQFWAQIRLLLDQYLIQERTIIWVTQKLRYNSRENLSQWL